MTEGAVSRTELQEAVREALRAEKASWGAAGSTVEGLLTKLMWFFVVVSLIPVVAASLLTPALLGDVLGTIQIGLGNITGAILTLAGLKIMHDRESARKS